MREALAARFDRDFIVSGSSRGGAKDMLAGLLRPGAAVLARHPVRALGGAILLATIGVVSVNALAWQTGRHPSPLFAAVPKPVDRRAAAQPTPVPPARPAVAAAPPIVAPPVPAVRSRDAVAEATRPSPMPVPRPRDPIGDAIRSGETGSVPSGGRLDAPKTVAAAQRALAKLGYASLKVDGVMGPGTRQAIERFERERKISVTGELNARTVKELGAQAGLALE